MTTLQECDDKVEKAFESFNRAADAHERALDGLYDAAKDVIKANSQKLTADERYMKAQASVNQAFQDMVSARSRACADVAAAIAQADGILHAELQQKAVA